MEDSRRYREEGSSTLTGVLRFSEEVFLELDLRDNTS